MADKESSILEEVESKGYRVITSGCAEADEFLGGESSSCLACPFGYCIYDIPHQGGGRPRNTERDLEIVSSDRTIKELSIKYNLSKQRIKGIIKKGMDNG